MCESAITERHLTEGIGISGNEITCDACAKSLQGAQVGGPDIQVDADNFATGRIDNRFDFDSTDTGPILDPNINASFDALDSGGSVSEMTIGQLANLGNVSTSRLRYYEKEGLLKPVGRTESGYRLYASNSAYQLRFILRAQRYGFSLSDIKLMIGLETEADEQNKIKAIAEQRLIDIGRRATQVLVQRRELEIFLNDLKACSGEKIPEELGGQYYELSEQSRAHQDDDATRSSVQNLAERMTCDLAEYEWTKELSDLRGRHMHIWQEDDSYHVLFIAAGENIRRALKRLVEAEVSCSAHKQPKVERIDDGVLFTAHGKNAFLYAQLFLTLEIQEGSLH